MKVRSYQIALFLSLSLESILTYWCHLLVLSINSFSKTLVWLGQLYNYLGASCESFHSNTPLLAEGIFSEATSCPHTGMFHLKLFLLEKLCRINSFARSTLSGKKQKAVSDRGKEIVSQICYTHQLLFCFPKLETCLGTGVSL